ncbi:hypothetical protein IHO40_02045 [Wolbachia endosymbiont of Mansonella ozzardi]|uniref:hypothetical protein n=1 Tax=Wolbachia endosymbiont of Mansonella ozzardi TaxID=137464 RepID=UPI001CE15434|nr:hypothetical protein [Wolbachia endosymbiont of Mansonella ozzardi]MCA4774923.1 hypothetical protein [Wolbachia endosymbiont of Mansonella ozzardi]
MRGVGDPIESITNYLNKKFPVSMERPLAGMNDIPGDECFKQKKQREVDQQARTGTPINQEMTDNGDQPLLKNERFRTKGLDNRNQKSSKASAPGRNYTSTFFMLSGAFVVGACLTIVNYPEISACPAAVTLGPF